MTDRPAQVRFARRFVIRHPERPDVHGVEFPSGIVLYDQPGIGLEAATSTGHIRDLTDGATIHWADDQPQEQPAARHDAGPTVRECAEADHAHWNDKYAGEER